MFSTAYSTAVHKKYKKHIFCMLLLPRFVPILRIILCFEEGYRCYLLLLHKYEPHPIIIKFIIEKFTIKKPIIKKPIILYNKTHCLFLGTRWKTPHLGSSLSSLSKISKSWQKVIQHRISFYQDSIFCPVSLVEDCNSH